MRAKLIEIRDEGTFIAALAVDVEAVNEAERYLLSRTGFTPHQHAPRFVLLSSNLSSHPMDMTYDVADWGVYGQRTYQTVHKWLKDTAWDEIEPGQVVDVQYILGETSAPKRPEREEFG